MLQATSRRLAAVERFGWAGIHGAQAHVEPGFWLLAPRKLTVVDGRMGSISVLSIYDSQKSLTCGEEKS